MNAPERALPPPPAPAPSAASEPWHARSAAQALQAQSVERGAGLSHDEAAARLAQHGRNSLPAARRRAPWLRFALQFHNPLIYVLLAAGAITFALDDLVDAGVILGVVLINGPTGLCG